MDVLRRDVGESVPAASGTDTDTGTDTSTDTLYQFGANTAAPRIRPVRKRSNASLAFDIQNDSV